MRALERACAIVAIAGALALPAPVQAAFGTTYSGLVCREMSDAASAFTFQTVFVGLTTCQTLCTQAAKLCDRYVLDATSCQLAFVNDWISFDSQADCAGFTGSDLSDCKASWEFDRQTWRASVLHDRDVARGSCVFTDNQCLKNCTGAP